MTPTEQLETLMGALRRQVYAEHRARRETMAVPSAIRSVRKGVTVIADDEFEREERRAREQAIARLWQCTGLLPAHREQVEHHAIADSCPHWTDALHRICAAIEPARVGSTIAIIGPNGCGKSQLAACVIRHACEMQLAARYVKAETLVDSMRATMGDGASESLRDVVARCTQPSLLVIDEIDKRNGSWFEDRNFARLIDDRCYRGRSTLLVGNYTPREFAEKFDPSVLSRIEERGEIIVCAAWKNWRKRDTRKGASQ